MGRVSYQDIDKYGGNGGAGFFSLKDDGDTARVRFMYNSVEDVEAFAVHEIRDDEDKRKYINCLRDYRQPLDTCPFCANKMRTQVKLFVPLYNIDTDNVQLWERGKKFMQKMTSVCSRYSNSTTPLCSHQFEIERNGKKGETTTTYEIYEVDKDDTKLEDLPEIPDPLGSVVLDKSFDDMGFYVENGYFPPDGDEADEAPPVRRRSSAREDSRDSGRERTRRTPGGRDVY